MSRQHLIPLLVISAATWIATWIAGCGGSGTPSCESGSECRSRVCVGADGIIGLSGDEVGSCAPICTSVDDCDEGEVCADYAGSGVLSCVPACASHDDVGYGAVCVGGVPTRCADAERGDAPCGRCCSIFEESCHLCTSDEFCDSDFQGGGECTPLGDVGDACELPEECASKNCSGDIGEPGTCLVAHGDPCDGSNCSRCVNTGGTTFCHEECSGSGGCPSGYQNCLGSREADTFWCYPDAGSIVDPCPDGYEYYSYEEWIGNFHYTCVPLNARIVCGTESVGAPCN